MPARSAALASWIARTSFWVMRQLGVAGGVQHVRERSAVGDDALRPRRHLTADRAVGFDQTRQVHLGDDVDDARTAHAGDARRGDRLVEAGIVRPHVRPDHLERRLERLAIDPHAFDGARRGALPAADLGTLERRPGRARRGVLAGAVAEHDLGVGADVDEQLHRVAAVRALGEHRGRGVGTDVTGDARPGVERRGGQVEVEVARQADHGLVGRQHERRRPERRRIDAERDVMHDRVPDEHDLEDVLAVDPGVGDELADQLVERGTHRGGELALAAGVHHHVRHPAHQVLAEADLGVHPSHARQHLTGREVAEVPGDRGRADVDRDTVDGADVARPHGDDQIGDRR